MAACFMVRVSRSISFSVARRSAFTLAVAAAAPSHRSDSSSKLPMPCSVRKFSVSAARFKFSMVAQCL